MAQRRHHYERAFEGYLRQKRLPYVAVDEAKKALLPEGVGFEVRGGGGVAACAAGAGGRAPARSIKSFDFVIYADGRNLLIEVKGRKVARRKPRMADGTSAPPKAKGSIEVPERTSMARGRGTGRLETWVTRGDVESLRAWETLFGEGFCGAFVFVYWCEEQPPDGLFQEVFAFDGRWYALRAVVVGDYARLMRQRSERWGTVDLAQSDFERVSEAFSEPWVAGEQMAK
ncbi:MAG: HYExAFE family protein [Phycisphaerales bacterium]